MTRHCNNEVVCKIIMCDCCYAKDAAWYRTSDGQEHEIIWRAGPEQDTIFHLRGVLVPG